MLALLREVWLLWVVAVLREALLPEDWEAAEDLETLEEDVEPD